MCVVVFSHIYISSLFLLSMSLFLFCLGLETALSVFVRGRKKDKVMVKLKIMLKFRVPIGGYDVVYRPWHFSTLDPQP